MVAGSEFTATITLGPDNDRKIRAMTHPVLRFELKKEIPYVLFIDRRPVGCFVNQVTKDGVHFRLSETGEDKYYRHRNIRKLYTRGDLVCFDGPDATDAFSHQLKKKLEKQFLSLPEPQQLAGIKNQWAMQQLDTFEARNGRVTANAIADLHAMAREKFGNLNGLSRPNLYKTRRLWLQSGGKLEAVTPNYQGRGCTDDKLDPRVIELTDFVVKTKFLQRPPISLDVAYAELLDSIAKENKNRPADDQLANPSKSYLRDWIGRLDQYDVTEARYGEQVARQKHGGFGRGETPTRPLEVVEIDHTPIDIIAIDDELEIIIGRVYLTVAIDKFTRCIVGFSIDFEKPSYVSVAKCLANAISFKDYVIERYPDIKNVWPCFGLMHRILVDRGPEFRSVALEMACNALGISIEYTRKRKPHLKGRVERCFRKINKDRFQMVRGTTFSNYMKRNGYKSEKFTVATMSAIEHALHIFVIDDYLQKPHRSLLDTPARKWLKHVEVFPPRMPPSQAYLNIALGREEQQKQVHHYGVELNHIKYSGPGVALIRNHKEYRPKKKYRVKRYDNDLTRIHVLSDSGEWVELIANNAADLVGLTAAHFKTLYDFCREELDESIDRIGIANAVVRFREALSGKRRIKPRATSKADAKRARLQSALDKRESARAPSSRAEPSVSSRPQEDARSGSTPIENARKQHEDTGSWSVEYDS